MYLSKYSTGWGVFLWVSLLGVYMDQNRIERITRTVRFGEIHLANWPYSYLAIHDLHTPLNMLKSD